MVSLQGSSVVHGFILIEVYWLKDLKPEIILCVLLIVMLIVTIVFYNLYKLRGKVSLNGSKEYELS